jgi:hypothetical protein
VLSRPDDRAVDKHADLNLNMRGYAATNSPRVLIDYDGDTDARAPQLAGLFGDNRTPAFATTFRVFDWDWSCNCRGPLLDDPEVTLVSIQTSPGEVIRVPSSGAQIGNGYSVLVLYADSDQITLKYTRSDGAVDGYTLHIQGISSDSSLLALYSQANSAGRAALPALRAGQSFGKAKGSDIRIAIRDAGTFMDPRSRKDWWKGR